MIWHWPLTYSSENTAAHLPLCSCPCINVSGFWLVLIAVRIKIYSFNYCQQQFYKYWSAILWYHEKQQKNYDGLLIVHFSTPHKWPLQIARIIIWLYVCGGGLRRQPEVPRLRNPLGLGVHVFKYWWLYKYSPASVSSFTQPVSNLNPSWTPSPYLRPKCHPSQVLRRCIGALPAWAAQPAAASRLFSMTTNPSRLRLTTRAASTATSPCAESRQSPYSCTPAPSTLAMAWPEPVERGLASGAPNPPHPAAPQVLWYHSIGCNITKSMISYGYDIPSYWYHRAISYAISYSRS